MQVRIEKSFESDVFKILDKALLRKIEAIIKELMEADSLQHVRNLKKLKEYSSYYRIRIGSYRLGLEHENNTLILTRFLHRNEFYKYFP